jgi:AcrR family transcriptional regulator
MPVDTMPPKREGTPPRQLPAAPNGSKPPCPGSVRVAEAQRSRMLSAAREIVSEHGYGRMSVALIVARAGVSRETFYGYFENCEDCFLAAFDEALAQMAGVMAPAYEGEGRWSERIRAALAALLGFLEYGADDRLTCFRGRAGGRVEGP